MLPPITRLIFRHGYSRMLVFFYSKTRCDRFVRDVLRAFAKLAASFELKTAHPTKDLRLPHALVSIRHKQNQMSWNRKFSRQVFSLMPASGGCFPKPRSRRPCPVYVMLG